MDPRRPITGLGLVILTIAVVGAAVLAGAGVWYWQYRANADLRARLDDSELTIAELREELRSARATASVPATGEPSQPATPSAVVEEPAPPAPGKPAREFAYIKKITETAGSYTWTLDYAQFLTGSAAAAAAAAHGDESPPPNDYYIVNDNPKLRTFPVAKTAKVTVYFGSPSDKAVLNLGQYYDVWLTDADGNGPHTGFWVTIQNGKVIAAEEQWTP